MTNLPVKPGIDGLPTNTIPTDPNAFVDWFKNSFLPRWAANADARNAIPTSASVKITGNTDTPAGIGIGANSITNGELVERAPLSVMGNPTGVLANVQDIAAGADNEALQRIAGALVWAPVSASINVADSITGLGTVVSPLELVGDALSPGNSQYYGTNVSGTKGFFPLSGSTITTLTSAGGTSQVYTVPSFAKTIMVILIGGGGGGGSGATRISGGVSGGGGGGGAGGISKATLRAADLGASVTVTFSSSPGGTGGAAQTVTNSNGNNGIAGANVSFGNFLAVTGAPPGVAGTNGAGAGGNPGGAGNWQIGLGGGQSGSAGATQSNATLGTSCFGNTGGGGGANTTAGGATNAGGPSAAGSPFLNLITATGGTSGGGNGGPGTNGTGDVPSSGGGGGGSAAGATPGGNGGQGGSFGAGGGGGGAAVGPSTSGAGGAGGLAAAIIIAF